jgi:hypothetical protein
MDDGRSGRDVTEVPSRQFPGTSDETFETTFRMMGLWDEIRERDFSAVSTLT